MPDAPSAPLRLLVIEDEAPIRRFLRIVLEGAGHAMDEAARGREGIERAATGAPSVVVLDLGLPDMDGKDVIAAIRAQSVQAPVGRIGARPISNDQQFQFNVQTQGRLTTSKQFGDIVLRANPDGSTVRLRSLLGGVVSGSQCNAGTIIPHKPTGERARV